MVYLVRLKYINCILINVCYIFSLVLSIWLTNFWFLSVEIGSHFAADFGYTLVYHQEQRNYQTASDICKSYGGTLPIIKNYIIPEIIADISSLR